MSCKVQDTLAHLLCQFCRQLHIQKTVCLQGADLRLQADSSRQQGQVDSLTQDLGKRREEALMRARRGQRITDVLLNNAASALTQLLATLRPGGGREAVEQTMLKHLLDQVG